ncbi:PREDICTED: LRR receptor-like serine/threonine-protein kinase FLS2 [Nelumbo nucifera]|uniref:LRR receptor-like serine/threonine-protein kinase FLS2 n=1 Tax=Nelumbo nucifera TaxID=4432 RepID=A0A1U8Q359_NELNU|nr:PREDICTED: LRR receptor-like serine/threonine-protein kinase FLS2 [Nelumbo nucifera]
MARCFNNKCFPWTMFQGLFGCLDKERKALLQLKHAFISGLNISKSLEWGDEEGGKVDDNDCCAWRVVKCNPSTGRVTHLLINQTRWWYYADPYDLSYFNLNASLFLPFEDLQYLDLSGSHIGGWIHNTGFEQLARLEKLEFLDLSYNNFNNTMLPSLGALTSLKTLSLRSNNFSGSFDIEELANLINLEVLDLSGNHLNDSFSLQGLCELKKLRELNIGYNNFGVTTSTLLPPCFNNLTFLRRIDLSSNQFKGNIPSFITTHTSLEHILLGDNKFSGSFSFSNFVNHSNLQVIDLGGNKLEVEAEHPHQVPTCFQLKELYLRNCTLLSGVVSRFLSSQYDLRVLDLSSTNLKGTFPTWILNNNTKLQQLNLGNNLLNGHFHLVSVYPKIAVVDISDNHIEGQLQANIGEVLPNLIFLNLAGNSIDGGIPSSIGNMSILWALDLSNNKLTGEIPKYLARGCTELSVLILSNNRLHGEIFPSYFNLTRLDNNLFKGTLRDGLSKCTELFNLDISNNQISGRIPSWITNFSSQLMTLFMQDNHFQGEIPTEIGQLKLLEFLDLSGNRLSGTLPSSLLMLQKLKYVKLQRNEFAGSLPVTLLNNSSSSLLALDMSYNNFSGSIPSMISELSELRVLSLKRNTLNGPIPYQLCQLKKIRLMVLSHNTFSGTIPQCFSNLNFGSKDDTENLFQDSVIPYSIGNMGYKSVTLEEVEFTTKRRADSYKGDILNYMSGLDLSCNRLTGKFPFEIGNLHGIRALNFSHNHLTGSIPKTFSKLRNIESLDLSCNRLNGTIPSELTELNSLAVFSVAHNNLSAKTPDFKKQFATFDSSSYEGNPLLCGPPLLKKCTKDEESSDDLVHAETQNESGIDVVFSTSFVVSYIMSLLGLMTILYVNPYWRRMWFISLKHAFIHPMALLPMFCTRGIDYIYLLP